MFIFDDFLVCKDVRFNLLPSLIRKIWDWAAYSFFAKMLQCFTLLVSNRTSVIWNYTLLNGLFGRWVLKGLSMKHKLWGSFDKTGEFLVDAWFVEISFDNLLFIFETLSEGVQSLLFPAVVRRENRLPVQTSIFLILPRFPKVYLLRILPLNWLRQKESLRYDRHLVTTVSLRAIEICRIDIITQRIAWGLNGGIELHCLFYLKCHNLRRYRITQKTYPKTPPRINNRTKLKNVLFYRWELTSLPNPPLRELQHNRNK